MNPCVVDAAPDAIIFLLDASMKSSYAFEGFKSFKKTVREVVEVVTALKEKEVSVTGKKC